jgi:hypothetical protein
VTGERFRYEESKFSPDPERGRRWYESLERLSPAVVRARLNQSTTGSAGSIHIGDEITITKGFAEEWVAWHDRREAEREDSFRRAEVRWLRWTVIVTVIVGAVGWLVAWLK